MRPWKTAAEYHYFPAASAFCRKWRFIPFRSDYIKLTADRLTYQPGDTAKPRHVFPTGYVGLACLAPMLEG